MHQEMVQLTDQWFSVVSTDLMQTQIVQYEVKSFVLTNLMLSCPVIERMVQCNLKWLNKIKSDLVWDETRGDQDLEIMTIFLTSDRISHQGQRRLKSRTWTQRKWWHLQFTHFCSLSCFRFNFSRLFATMVWILFYVLKLSFKLTMLIP